MSEYVTVPREPTPEMIAAGRKVRQDGFSEIAIFDAMIAAAPPSPPPSSVKAREIDAFEAGYIQGHDATVEGRYADPSDAAQDYVRTLLAPAVDERAASSEAAVVVAKVDCGDAEQLSARITEYLRGGGLWNPECMDHDKVRRLLIDCRTEFDAAIADSAIKAAIAQVDAARTEGKGNG